jgi:hypothetical protein
VSRGSTRLASAHLPADQAPASNAETRTSQGAGMTSTRIPQARWHYLVYGGITAKPAIQAQ